MYHCPFYTGLSEAQVVADAASATRGEVLRSRVTLHYLALWSLLGLVCVCACVCVCVFVCLCVCVFVCFLFLSWLYLYRRGYSVHVLMLFCASLQVEVCFQSFLARRLAAAGSGGAGESALGEHKREPSGAGRVCRGECLPAALPGVGMQLLRSLSGHNDAAQKTAAVAEAAAGGGDVAGSGDASGGGVSAATRAGADDEETPRSATSHVRLRLAQLASAAQVVDPAGASEHAYRGRSGAFGLRDALASPKKKAGSVGSVGRQPKANAGAKAGSVQGGAAKAKMPAKKSSNQTTRRFYDTMGMVEEDLGLTVCCRYPHRSCSSSHPTSVFPDALTSRNLPHHS